ncbi:MAG TPA: tetratricopeptide repeat protein [Spirochaetota bacterium]|nr:tetratricopeptide repeat protein [Spirochaetota bacterium]HNT12348.1 tetratricopeptide repeat protein [Spirochaetota bacterium]
MKNRCFVPFVTVLIPVALSLSGCTSAPPVPTKPAAEPTASREIVADWHLYSMGLYYKSTKNYTTAIKYFLDAAAHGVALDLVYEKLAECYSLLFDYDTAINYAKLSIEKNPSSPAPYLLLYRIYVNLNNHQQAAEALERLIAVDPEPVEVHFRLGVHYYTRMKNYDRALVSFRAILDIAASKHVEDRYLEYAHYYIGYIHYNKGQIDASIEHFARSADINPGNAQTLNILIILLMHSTQIDRAAGYAAQFLERYPDNARMNAVMGQILYLRNSPRAKSHLRRGMGDASPYGITARGLYYELLRRDDRALASIKKSLENNPGAVAAHVALAKLSLRKHKKRVALSEYFTAGILLYKAKQYSDARTYLTKSLALDDGIPETYIYLGKISEETGNRSLAIVHYKKANQLQPRSDIYSHLGYLYSQRNDFAESMRNFDRAIAMEPKNPKSYFIKGIVLSDRKDYPRAEQEFRTAVSLDGNDTYYFYLATVQEKQRKLDEAMDSLRRALAVNAENPRACNYLGYLYADNNMRLDESIDLIRRALKHEPRNGAYLDSLGWAYYRKGDYQRALKKLLEAQRLLERDKASDPVVYDHIADTYKMIGDREKALEYWRKSLHLEKNPAIETKIREIEALIKQQGN